MELELRPYQKEALASIPEAGAFLICLATGLGKSVVFSQVPRRGRMLILSHRDELVHQPEKYFDCTFGVEQGDEKSHGEEVISASVQSLVRRLDKFKPDDFDVLVTDECFVGSTLVDGRPIKKVQAGDYVTAYNHKTGRLEMKKVVKVYKNPMPKYLVKINSKLICTLNHPIYDIRQERYVPAGKLCVDDLMYTRSGLCEPVLGLELIRASTKNDKCVYNLEVEDLHNYFANGYLVHNCHHSTAPTYRKIYDYFKPRLHLGFTATPNRNDGIGLKAIYEDIIFERNLKWGIENGYLSKIHCLRVDIGVDLRRVAQRLGDYAPEALERTINIESANKAVAEAYRLYAKPPALIFCASVAHAEALATLIPGAVAVKGGEDRSAVIQAFSEGKIPCITNCMVFTEGTDLPCVQTVIVARPTKNNSLYCLDEQTEILTVDGWKKDVRIGERVATYDIKTGQIEYSPVLATIRRQLEPDEYFCRFHGQSSDIRVTNHHRMIIMPRHKSSYSFVEAESLLNKYNRYHIPVAGIMKFKGVPLTDAELTFIGWVMTDGTINRCNNQITISQSSHHVDYCQEIEQCIIDCGFKYSKHVYERRGVNWHQSGKNVNWTISYGKPRGRDKHLTGWSRLEAYLSKDLSPSLFEMTEHQFEVMLTAIWHADGHKNCYPDTKHISKGNKTFIERLQIMGILRGYRASVSLCQRKNAKDLWTLHIKHQDFIFISEFNSEAHAHWIKEQHTNESCWCVQTEQGTLVTRRNGKVTILGNCQIAGRGMRLYPGKEYMTLIDCVGAGDNADLCTAPSLLGLDIENVPASQRKKLQGDLFDLPEIARELEDTPEAWIRNVHYVDLWAKRNSYDMHGINFFKMPDGSLVLSEPRMILPAEDSLGRIEWNGRPEPAQKVFDEVYQELKRNYEDKRPLWDLNLMRYWGASPATEKQIAVIARKYPDYDTSGLTKFEAGQILTRISAEPATEKQKYFLMRRGINPEGLSKQEAMKLIGELKGA